MYLRHGLREITEGIPMNKITIITITTINSTTFEVTVQSRTTTTHQVTLTATYYKKLTNEQVTAEELLKTSFKFLLERESNTSILSSFELPLINRYFPDYEKTIQEQLS